MKLTLTAIQDKQGHIFMVISGIYSRQQLLSWQLFISQSRNLSYDKNYYFSGQQMEKQIHIQIASKLAEAILQTRLQVKKALFKHLQSIINTLKAPSFSLYTSPQDFLYALIPDNTYCIQEKLSKMPQGSSFVARVTLEVHFSLIQRVSGLSTQAENWLIDIICKKKHQSKESLVMVAQFFSEAILILNKLPLFSVYQKDRSMKNKFILKHSIVLERQQSVQYSLLDLRGQHYIQRLNEQLHLFARVSYIPALGYLDPRSTLSVAEKKERERKESQVLSEGEDRVSVYVFYDADLDFTFLTSDEENLKKKEDVQEVKISVTQESEEFQLLISNEDQDFFDKNREILESLAQAEKKYFI